MAELPFTCQSSYFASKSFVRFSAAYENPETLKDDLLSIIDGIKEELKQKAPLEGTTLTCCRAFFEQEQVRLIGFNIGDSMLFSWNPETQTLSNLLPAHVSVAGTAIFPPAYRPFEVHTLDLSVSQSALIFLLSDGIHDSLPYEEVEGVYPNGLHYRKRSLDQKKLKELFLKLEPKASIKEYLLKVTQEVFDHVEKERKGHQNTPFKIGDDVAILGCALQRDGIFTQLKNKLFSWS